MVRLNVAIRYPRVMNSLLAVKILCENYSPGELEERLEFTLFDVADGLEVYVEQHWDEVMELLREDLYL